MILRRIDLADIDNDGELEPLMVEGPWFQANLSYCNGLTINTIELDSIYGLNSTLQYCESGPLAGNALVFFAKLDSNRMYVETYWAKIDISTFEVTYSDSVFSRELYSFVYTLSGDIWAIDSEELGIYKSTDLGGTFNLVRYIGEGDPNFGTPSNGPSTIPIQASADGQYLSIISAFEEASLSGSPDGVYWYYSTDSGNTWQGEFIGKGGPGGIEYGQIVNRDYAPYFSTWKDGNLNVDAQGITHVAFNGIGFGILPGEIDTTDVFPMLYWNSKDKQWIAISDPAYEAPDDGFGHSIQIFAPGRAIGQSHPSISSRNDGETIVVAWTAVEFEGIPGLSPYNIYSALNQPDDYYYTDLVYNISFDGGENFHHQVQTLKGEPDIAELYSYLNPELESINNTLYMHYIYFIDPIPGSFILGENSSSDGTWIYDKKAALIVSVENENDSPVKRFELGQNYPNPFNPSTKIKFTIPTSPLNPSPYQGEGQRERLITLKVYDVLGNEVSTLINKEMQAGSYEVEFDASNLPSGIYFYMLNAGEFARSRKMILLK